MTARLLGKHFRHLSMGKLMMAIDLVVIVISAAVFNSIESALYAVSYTHLIIAVMITPLTSTIPQLSLDLLEGQEALQENNTEFSSKVDQQLMDACLLYTSRCV